MKEQNAQIELYLHFAQKDLFNGKFSRNTKKKHTRNICIPYTLIPSILYSYANVALSVCLFYAGPNVLLYPVEYYILKKYIYMYVYNIYNLYVVYILYILYMYTHKNCTWLFPFIHM